MHTHIHTYTPQGEQKDRKECAKLDTHKNTNRRHTYTHSYIHTYTHTYIHAYIHTHHKVSRKAGRSAQNISLLLSFCLCLFTVFTTVFTTYTPQGEQKGGKECAKQKRLHGFIAFTEESVPHRVCVRLFSLGGLV